MRVLDRSDGPSKGFGAHVTSPNDTSSSGAGLSEAQPTVDTRVLDRNEGPSPHAHSLFGFQSRPGPPAPEGLASPWPFEGPRLHQGVGWLGARWSNRAECLVLLSGSSPKSLIMEERELRLVSESG